MAVGKIAGDGWFLLSPGDKVVLINPRPGAELGRFMKSVWLVTQVHRYLDRAFVVLLARGWRKKAIINVVSAYDGSRRRPLVLLAKTTVGEKQ
jgi:hypothetical protein